MIIFILSPLDYIPLGATDSVAQLKLQQFFMITRVKLREMEQIMPENRLIVRRWQMAEDRWLMKV